MKPIPMLDVAGEMARLWPEISAAAERVLRSGRFVLGPEVEAFEREAAAWLGVEHAVGVNSGTDAVALALRALGIGPGDEVLTTPFTFFATPEAISMTGAVPVFVDVEEEGFNIDPERLEAAITGRTRAVVPVHLFGRPAAMERILEVAARYDLPVVEDCAQAFGATFGSARVGALGTAGAFSFFPSKNLGACGDGGLIVTDDAELAGLARMLGNHGSRRRHHHEMLGTTSRLDALQAAILRVKLPHVDAWNEARRTAARRYHELLADVPGIVLPQVTEGHVFHQYTVRFTGGERNAVQARLAERGIASSVFYAVPQNRQPMYAGRQAAMPVSDRLADEVLSLPIWPHMPAALQQRIADAVLG